MKLHQDGDQSKQANNYDMDSDREMLDDSDDNDSDSGRPMGKHGNSQAEKRAHHNALERKRRDHIKDSFTSLREAVPSLQGEKASRAQILKKAAEYIQSMRRKNQNQNKDIEDLKRQNSIIESQIRQLERARDSYNGAGGGEVGQDIDDSSEPEENSGITNASIGGSASNNGNGAGFGRRNKKLKTNTNY